MFIERLQSELTPHHNGENLGTFHDLKSDRDELMSDQQKSQEATQSEQEEEVSRLQNFLLKEEEFRIYLEKKVSQEAFGRNVELIAGFLTLGTSALNVVFQYLEPMPGPIYAVFNKIDYAASIYFLAVFILKLYVASHRGNHLMQTQSILEIIVFAPILLFNNVKYESQLFVFLPFSRYIRSIQSFMIMSRYYKLGQTDVDRQINIVFITMVLLTYISSGIYSIVENRNRAIDDMNFLQLHDSVYFVIVTLGTVGYGDEIPMTEFGRVVVLIIIFLTIVLIPAQTNELLRLMSIRSRFRRTEYKSLDVQHIVICGSVDVGALTNFCQELYHPDHGGDATNVVIMQDFDPNGDMDGFLNKHFLSMTYLAGDLFEESDLARAMLHTAEQCILLTNKNSKDSQKQDHKNILTALALKKFVYDKNKHLKNQDRQNLSLCIQLIKPESKYLYYKSLNISAAKDQLIIVEEIKMNLLAKSCFAPGLIACMSNLSASASTDDLNLEEIWLNEYANGMGHEIYRMQISQDKFENANPQKVTFRNIADCAFFEFQSLIFALEIELKDSGKSIVRLNPALFLFEDWDNFNYYLYIICEDESNAEQVQNMDIPMEKFESYFGDPDEDKPKNEQDGGGGGDQNEKGMIVGCEDGIIDIDNPEIMNMKTSENFYKKDDSKQNKLVEEVKLEIRNKDNKKYNQSNSNLNLPKKEAAINQSLQNKSKILKIKPNGKKGQTKKIDAKTSRQSDLEKNYDMLPNQQTLTEVIINEKNIKLKNHIVVCGFHSSIYHFILPLRAKYLMSYQQDIVIVAPHIKKDIWEGICRFPRVFIVEGSPLSHEVLRQACIKKASKAVIMGFDPSISTETFSELTEEMIDAKSIFIYKAIKEINPQLQVFTEIFYQSNIDYLLKKQKKSNNLGYNFGSLYAAGEVYISSTIDTLTAQSFYNPHIVTIFQQILVGNSEKKLDEEDPEQEIMEMFDERLDQSNLWQILVPEEFVKQTYEKLFKHLLDRNLVALGLYRLPGATDNMSAYCYTNPDPSTSITYKDRVFVLGKDIPDDISLDIQPANKFKDERNTKKQRAKILKANQIKDSAEAYYGIRKHEPPQQQQQPAEQTNQSPRDASAPKTQSQESLHNIQSPDIVLKKGTTFGQRSQSAQAGIRNPTLSFKQRNASTAQPKKKRATSPPKAKPKKSVDDPKQKENFYDESQDQQITSMEFMLRAINELEKQLTTIESSVQKVKLKIDEQNNKIKQNVHTIKKKIIEKAIIVEESGFKKDNNPQ